MKKSALIYHYPQELVALTPQYPPRIMRVPFLKNPIEIAMSDLLNEIAPQDVLVINMTKVLPRRIWALDGSEVLFIQSRTSDNKEWEVLFPASRYNQNQMIELPGNIKLNILSKGLPQYVQCSAPLTDDYFNQYGELPLPPYIQKMRKQRHNLPQDSLWYQTAWAQIPGSLAAPTASLHFKDQDIQRLKDKNVVIAHIVLHVGLGTFLPVKSENLEHHKMHQEFVEIPQASWEQILQAKAQKRKIWALGTTVMRSVESVPLNFFNQDRQGYRGYTDLFIRPGFKFQIVDRLLTNFHQPESTLLALVAAVQGLEHVLSCYQWAIERKFRLFSYGDLSVWDVN